MNKPKCKEKDCPNEAYHADPIYHSKYCKDHLDLDENLKPFTNEEAEEYFNNNDLERIKMRQAFKLVQIIKNEITKLKKVKKDHPYNWSMHIKPKHDYLKGLLRRSEK